MPSACFDFFFWKLFCELLAHGKNLQSKTNTLSQRQRTFPMWGKKCDVSSSKFKRKNYQTETVWLSLSYSVSSLRKHPFLLALRRWGRSYNPRQKSMKHLCTSLSLCNFEMLLQSCVATSNAVDIFILLHSMVNRCKNPEIHAVARSELNSWVGYLVNFISNRFLSYKTHIWNRIRVKTNGPWR